MKQLTLCIKCGQHETGYITGICSHCRGNNLNFKPRTRPARKRYTRKQSENAGKFFASR